MAALSLLGCFLQAAKHTSSIHNEVYLLNIHIRYPQFRIFVIPVIADVLEREAEGLALAGRKR
jgi:hypothetical protein